MLLLLIIYTIYINYKCYISFQTVLHVLSIVVSLGSFYLFSIVYDSMCLNCFGVRSSYWVIFVCFGSAVHWLVILLSTVVAVLPRLVWNMHSAVQIFINIHYFYSLLLTTVRISLCPDDSTKVILQSKRERSRGEGLLVTWSRSTSASSIYR